ncbi:M24 family metallopeptidase [Humibacter ginsenosidimutans]|uniref:Aminopeptidase P family protein n=1 Tax=Humibacter ginsenosidimutans TaxID=2599293 RepID=A0A5B8M357_9MICO|nr:Xaa-Pro peptidase family protein [Humibacter ginsenosidimutans]QDZ14716.1 aminopeptidase P family protein [Humibacter ginsenosidimutans]
MAEQRFAASVYSSRLERAAELARDSGLDAVVVTPGPDFQYLLGSRAATFERLTALVVPAQGEPFVVVPRMELAALRASAVGEAGIELRDWVDGDDPYALALTGLGVVRRLGVSEATPALHTVPLATSADTAPELATPVLRRLRMVKDAAEIVALREAGAAIDRVHARMGEWLRVGRTEREVGADIAAAIVQEGHAEADFVIVASGPNGADPHHEVSDRVIAGGEAVVVDIGGPTALGYNSDSTRTYAVGEVPVGIRDAYAALERAQQSAVDAVRPGVTAESVDAAARDVLAEVGLADRFIHRTGHGIGLSVHEEPYIVAGNTLQLEPGMAFSIEPGIYFPGEWGARIEDIVVVTDGGVEPLNLRPHSLAQL